MQPSNKPKQTQGNRKYSLGELSVIIQAAIEEIGSLEGEKPDTMAVGLACLNKIKKQNRRVLHAVARTSTDLDKSSVKTFIERNANDYYNALLKIMRTVEAVSNVLKQLKAEAEDESAPSRNAVIAVLKKKNVFAFLYQPDNSLAVKTLQDATRLHEAYNDAKLASSKSAQTQRKKTKKTYVLYIKLLLCYKRRSFQSS